jgi:glycosyltransferase involved in cell wall biosynthesis
VFVLRLIAIKGLLRLLMFTDSVPLISVLMPAYNQGAFIADSIRSVQAQTLPQWELIIVNDGSTDDTLAVCQAMAQQDPRIVLIDLPQNTANFAKVRNIALGHAKAPYIACLDSDDLYEPNAFTLLHAHLHAHPDCTMVYGGFGLIDENGTPLPQAQQPHGITATPSGFICQSHPAHTWDNIVLARVTNQVQAMLLPRQTLETLGGWTETGPAASLADFDLTIRLYQLGFDQVHNLTVPVFRYRHNMSSSMTYNPANHRKKCDATLAIVQQFLNSPQAPAALKAQQSFLLATLTSMYMRNAIRAGHHGAFVQLLKHVFTLPNVKWPHALLVSLKTLVRGYVQRV